MSAIPPPSPPSGDPMSAPSPQPTQEETRACPVCQGAGQIPTSMGRDEILQAVDANMPTPDQPEQGEMSEGNSLPEINAAKPFTIPGRQPLDAGQQQEVNRLGDRARSRMANGPKL